jgi:bacterioferritin (cytochrome b1)
MDKKKVVKLLNQALAMEHATVIRLSTQAALLTGPYAIVIGDKLKAFATEETRHADDLRDRLVALGEKPTTDVGDIDVGNKLKKMLAINIDEEKAAINVYQQIMRVVPKDENLILYETVEDLLRDEQKDLEDMERLLE